MVRERENNTCGVEVEWKRVGGVTWGGLRKAGREENKQKHVFFEHAITKQNIL